MKRCFILIISSLFFLACAGPRGDSAGIINGSRISYPEFIRALQNNTIDFRSNTNRPPDDREKTQIFNDTWRNLAMRTILNDYYEKYKITASPQEVIDTLSTSIPAFIRNSEIFFTDGIFDRELYLQSLKYDSPVNLSGIRQGYLEDYIPMQKLKPRIIDDELLTRKVRQNIADIISSNSDFDLLVFNPDNMVALISEQELKSYYQQNMDDFALEPIYSISYLSIPVALQEQDEDYTWAVADSIYAEISHGKSFDVLLEEKKEHLPGLQVTESGFVRVENVDESILNIIEALPDNAQSKLIRQDNGYFIYQKLQRTKSMINFRTLQIPPIISPATVNAQHSKALGALALARSLGMSDAAIELGLPLHESGDIIFGEKWHQDPVIVTTIEGRLRELKKGDFIDPVYSPANGSWIVAQLGENQVHRARAFNEVRDSLMLDLQLMRQKQLAKQKAEEWLILNPGQQVSPDATDYDIVPFNHTGIDAKYEGMNLDNYYLRAMMQYHNHSSLMVQQIDDKSIILIPRKINSTNGSAVDQLTIQRYFVQTLSPDWFEKWMEDKLNRAKIQIFVTP